VNVTGSPLDRRQCLLRAAALGAAGLVGTDAVQAGGQLEEPLADSVRSVLSAAIASSAPPVPEFTDTSRRLAYSALAGGHERSPAPTQARLPDPHRVSADGLVRNPACRAGHHDGLGLIQVESAFRKFAISRVGARGYMQIMPFWSRVIGDGDAGKLFHMQTNIRFGCVILRHYLDRERGDTFMALGRYNGSRGKPQYPNAVYAAAKNWVHPDA
jgi:hypothetical protein